MNSNEYLFGSICEILERKSGLVLATIIAQQGSSPRHLGAKMVVGPEGRGYGTIGGSLLEASVIKESAAILRSDGESKLMDFDLTSQDVNSKGMICGGTATVMLDYVKDTPENRDYFKNARDAVSRGEDFTALTFYKNSGPALNIVARCLRFRDGRVTGSCPLPASELESLSSDNPELSVKRDHDLQIIADPIQKTKTLYCFGAGHVAKSTAQIAALVGFRVVLIDDRSEFANLERFPDAWEIHVIENFNQALDNLDIDNDSFIVILTHGHLFDREVLEQALKTRAGYIGMIGSRKKISAIYSALIEKGISQDEIKRVHSPIGIAIQAETPEEIAVSIVAELIAVRAGNQA